MKKIPAFLTLTIIALVAAVFLAATDGITREPIRQAAITAANTARAAVLPQADSFEEQDAEEGIDSFYAGSKDGQLVGHVATVTVQGFGGPIEVTIGMDTGHQLTGLSVGGSAFAETAGLGTLAKEPAFTDQFMGKAAPITLGTDVDAISGATITSRAVVNGVNLAAQAMGADAAAQGADTSSQATDTNDSASPSAQKAAPVQDRGTILALVFPQADAYQEQTPPTGIDALYTAETSAGIIGHVVVVTAQGFAGPVEVTVGMDLAGQITGISVGGGGFAETTGYGSRAQEPAFTDQFMGKTPPVTMGGEVDAVSGATITSQAVVKAVNLGLEAVQALEK